MKSQTFIQTLIQRRGLSGSLKSTDDAVDAETENERALADAPDDALPAVRPPAAAAPRKTTAASIRAQRRFWFQAPRENTVPATRFVLTDAVLTDALAGSAGGEALAVVYSGTARRHPWPSRNGEFVMDGVGVATLANGDVYDGECVLGMFHGSGVMRYANGDVYDGQWADNQRHGYGVLEYTLGRQGSSRACIEATTTAKASATLDVALDATIEMDESLALAPDPPAAAAAAASRPLATYVGLFRLGEKDGLGEETIPGIGFFTGVYHRGLPNGVGRMRCTNGDVHDGVYSDGRLHGLCTVTYASGDVFVATFVRGVVDGPARYTQADTGDCYTEWFDMGVNTVGVLEPGEDVVPPSIDALLSPKRRKTSMGSQPWAALLQQKAASPKAAATATKSRVAAVSLPPQGEADGNGDGETADEYEERRAREAFERRRSSTVKRRVCVVDFVADGAHYEGQWRREASGSNRRGVRHGPGTLRFPSGHVFKGCFENDAAEGEGTVFFAPPPPPSREATGTNDVRAAAVMVMFADAESTALPEAATDEASTDGMSRPFPVEFQGSFHNNLVDGKGTLLFSNGTSLEGFWTRGRRNGVWHAHPAPDRARFRGDVRAGLFEFDVAVPLDYHCRSAADEARAKQD